MKLICPACGATNSLESLLTDTESRLFVDAFSKLPAQIMPHTLRYLALFRPQSGRVLQWKKAKRLLEDLHLEIKKGHVQQKGKVSRPCPPFVWASALERILELDIRSLPLKNHNYLKAIVYDMADEVDRKGEYKRNRLERTGAIRQRDTSAEPERMTITKEMFRDMRGKIHGDTKQ